MPAADDLTPAFLSGSELFGDDLESAELEAWYADEAEGYADLAYDDSVEGYPYHELNRRCGFSHLPAGRFTHSLGLGSATGAEFIPVVSRIDRLTIVEPSQTNRAQDICGLAPRYVNPSMSGTLPFDDRTFDLATCFGVLHHIARVSTVLNELHRTLMPGGMLLLNEPTISMGDWRLPRPGLTRRERGLPLPWLMSHVHNLDFEIIATTRHSFPLADKLRTEAALARIGQRRAVTIDVALSRSFAWNARRYHATKSWHKLRPRAVFLVLRRRK